MSLSKEQLKHDRINVGRLVKRLEVTISDGRWTEGDQMYGEDAWVKVHGMAQVRRFSFNACVRVDFLTVLSENTLR
jgi:hypothetical protein